MRKNHMPKKLFDTTSLTASEDNVVHDDSKAEKSSQKPLNNNDQRETGSPLSNNSQVTYREQREIRTFDKDGNIIKQEQIESIQTLIGNNDNNASSNSNRNSSISARKRRNTLDIALNPNLRDQLQIASRKVCDDEYQDKDSSHEDRDEEAIEALECYQQHLARLGTSQNKEKSVS